MPTPTMDAYGAPVRTGSSLARTHRPQPTEQPQAQPLYPISPLLQERLQRSRRVESERMSARSSNDMLSSSTSSRHVRSPSPTDSQRPRSSGGSDAAKPRKGLGVKEMEQTLSTLHKQNFDLKLELYHRRERQTVLEERLDRMEREAKERDDLNDALVRELEKRDKAVEEAIGMILALEKRVEQLLLERNIVRQVEAEGNAYPRIESPTVTTPAAKTSTKFESSQFGVAKTPTRMPSFLSEQSDNAENLKSVYLAALAGESTLSLPKLAGDTPDTARMDPRLASPALSDLSESSFISIYGRGKTAELSSRPGNSPRPWHTMSKTPAPALESPTRLRTSTPSGHHRPSSSRATSGQFQNITGVLEVGSSPLQRLGKLDVAHTAKDQSPSARPTTTKGQQKTKKEKREALERVLTQGHYASPQTLPPTPDTLSTTTLPHHDTPPREQRPRTEYSNAFVTQPTASRSSGNDEQKPLTRATQPLSTAAFDDWRELSTTENACLKTTAAAPGTHRLRPATDASKYKHNPRRDSTASSVDTWLRESLKPDSLDVLGPMSSVSQAHASTKSGRNSPDLFSFPTSNAGWAAHAMFGSLGGSGYIGAGGKSASATPIADMLDAIGAAVSTPPILNAGRLTPTIGAGPTAPPPPNRRSSLLARTGLAADATPGTESLPQSPPAVSTSAPIRSPAGGNRARSNSTDVRPPTRHVTDLGLKQDRARTVPPKQVHQPPPPTAKDSSSNISAEQGSSGPSQQPLPKQRHYPPQAQTSRPRSRGLNNFFRRSTGSAGDLPGPPASAPPTQTALKPPPPPLTAPTTAMGIPSWVRRSSLASEGDGRANGATPPPILRNKAAAGGSARVADDDDGGVALEDSGSGSPAPGAGRGGAPVGVLPKLSSSRRSWGSGSGEVGGDGGGVPIGGGGKRKWLGLGRVSSLRNRGGA